MKLADRLLVWFEVLVNVPGSNPAFYLRRGSEVLNEAEKALAPLAALEDGYWSVDGQHNFTNDYVLINQLGTKLTVGDVREAARVLREIQDKGD